MKWARSWQQKTRSIITEQAQCELNSPAQFHQLWAFSSFKTLISHEPSIPNVARVKIWQKTRSCIIMTIWMSQGQHSQLVPRSRANTHWYRCPKICHDMYHNCSIFMLHACSWFCCTWRQRQCMSCYILCLQPLLLIPDKISILFQSFSMITLLTESNASNRYLFIPNKTSTLSWSFSMIMLIL